ncbi:right-handed parallel beta-helix repeat-containing protein [Flexithrix dorotheae]|uniref:right-handed parallel beta-helix repeat-containing protein n=1 Tax=Flexithrix dorotheae TaxID=70993 RepID=UPI0012FBB60A|nr:right-handed parallel beta-helix repeat-containing protein [Flexithrix dorotheae]
MKLIFTFIILSCFHQWIFATNFYINPSGGNDKHNGKSPDAAWKSSKPLESIFLKPGDSLLVLANDTLTGGIFLENAQGSREQPIVISRYGTGNNPVIDGDENKAAIHITNPEFITVEHLVITNPKGENGILMEAKDAGELSQVRIDHVEVYAVFDEAANISYPPKTKGGIVFKANKDEKPSWWNGIIIENCHLHDLGSCGISIGSDYKVNKGIADGEVTYPILGVSIRNNKIHDIVRDGAIIRQCKDGIMEYNEVWRTGLVAISNGIWWYDSDHCILQFNEGYQCKAAFDRDGAPFSIDNSSTNCIIQYNYSHDNEGPGYMLFGHDDNGHDNIIRHNISVNDHTNNASSGTGSIAIVSRVVKGYIEDNIVIAGGGTKSILGHRSWDGLPKDVNYKGNIFVGNGLAYFGYEIIPAGKFENNFFINIPNLPEELKQENNLKSFFENQQKIQTIIEKCGVQN